jgi:hypothetical protein
MHVVVVVVLVKKYMGAGFLFLDDTPYPCACMRRQVHVHFISGLP